MTVCIVTGSGGLVGSEAVEHFAAAGMRVVGIDNDMRSRLFGPDSSTKARSQDLQEKLRGNFLHLPVDIRDKDKIDRIFAQYCGDIGLVVHTAAQPSHDWAAQMPEVDWGINATGTLNLLEATRRFAPKATFIQVSTNKVYGDRPNAIPVRDCNMRWDVRRFNNFWNGIDENMVVDASLHSLFGASKLAGDVLAQEYGRYFGMRTGIFRCGCITGKNHAGARLHGFLSFLAKCLITDRPYLIYGYKGKQVRDNIHARDLVAAFHEFHKAPRPGEVYNLGGGRDNSVSVLEAIVKLEELTGRRLRCSYHNQARIGDHRWYITNNEKFRRHYPQWDIRTSLGDILEELAA